MAIFLWKIWGKKLYSKRILIRENDKIINALWQDGRIVQLDIEDIDTSNRLLGNIYIGKVKNIVSNIRAAFIEIGNGQMGYFSIDQNRDPIYTKKGNSKILCAGDEVLVQVSKEPLKSKDPVLTSEITLSGKYAVLIHGSTGVSVSGKIKDLEFKNQIKEAVLPFVSDQFAIIIRTNAYSVGVEQVLFEIEMLKKQYEEVLQKALHRSCFSKVYEPPAGYLSAIRDTYDDALTEIITDDAIVYQNLKDFLEQYDPSNLQKIRFYEDKLLSLTKLYGIHSCIENALKAKVWLKSGGYLVIQPTEALVVIDVNSGKAIEGKESAEDTFLKINLEAIQEIVYQLRLRNLSGIIIIDFIDMKRPENKERLLSEVKRLVKLDPVKTVFVEMTKLNLVEITRKKIKKPLHEIWKKM